MSLDVVAHVHGRSSTRRWLVAGLRRFPGLDRGLRALHLRIKLAVLHESTFGAYLLDWLHARRFMHWSAQETNAQKLAAELLFQYHKLEKGLCMPGAKRFFGLEPAHATASLVKRWRIAGLSTTDPVYLGALETLRSYSDRLTLTPAPDAVRARLLLELGQALDGAVVHPEFATPMQRIEPSTDVSEVFKQLSLQRRSVRSFARGVVHESVIQCAVAVALLSPSVCNRQPWKVHRYTRADRVAAMLALQNGNAGFGHEVETLLVIAVDSHCYFDGTERNQAYVDGGLFTMSLLLALQSLGVSSCCLNWCALPKVDKAAHLLGDIPDHERIITFLAVGHAADDALVPRSPRRASSSIINTHD